jgi:RNA polymerase sigma-70 factor (ECF subfamily)
VHRSLPRRQERETIDRDVDANDLSPVSRELARWRRSNNATGSCCCGGRWPPPDTLRTAVLMRDIQELSYQEIADALRLPEGTVKSRINRGRTELARQIRKLRGDDFSPNDAVARRTAKRTGAY